MAINDLIGSVLFRSGASHYHFLLAPWTLNRWQICYEVCRGYTHTLLCVIVFEHSREDKWNEKLMKFCENSSRWTTLRKIIYMNGYDRLQQAGKEDLLQKPWCLKTSCCFDILCFIGIRIAVCHSSHRSCTGWKEYLKLNSRWSGSF